MAYNDINEIKEAAKRSRHSKHWFDADTLAFFSGRVEPRVWPLPDDSGALFVTSEKTGEGHPRLYTVRMADSEGEISNVGEFMAHETLSGAKNHAACHVGAIARNAECPYNETMRCQTERITD